MTKVTPKETKGQSGRLLRLLPYILATLLWIVLATRGQFFLRKVEDLSLFLFDSEYISDALSTPGGLLGVASSFLTQFLCYPWAGAFIWTVLLLIIYQLTVKAFDIPRVYDSLCLIPSVLLVIADVSLGYGIFIMRSQDYFFAPLLGYLLALVPVFAARRISNAAIRTAMLAVWSAAGFALAGAYALAGTLAAAITAPRKETSRSNRLAVLAAGIAIVILTPVIMNGLYTSFRMADGWTVGLPDVSEADWTRAVRTPFQLTLLCLPLLAMSSCLLKERNGLKLLPVAVYALSAAAVYGFWFKDGNFRTELAMSEAVDRFDWQKAIDIYQEQVNSHVKSDAKAYAARTAKLAGIKDQDERSQITEKFRSHFFEPTRTMVLYRDLALFKMNRALDEAFTMRDGGRPQKSRTQISMAYQSGSQLYLQYGLPNLCYRWCLENAVEHGWTNSSIKCMALLSILTGEQEMAYKFLGKLDRTLFHRKWGAQYRQLASDVTQAASARPFNTILPLMCFEDNMTNDLGKCETHLMRHFLQEVPNTTTPEFDRASLLWAMRTQSIPDFWSKLSAYLDTNPASKLPRGVQEAALLYTSLEKRGLNIQYDEKVTDSYNRFTQYVSKHQVHDLKESAYPFCQQFGKTFYYFYYFIRDIQTY